MSLLASLRDLELSICRAVACGMRGPVADEVAALVNDVIFGAGFFVLLLLLSCVTARGRSRVLRVVVTLVLGMGISHGVRALVWAVAPRARPGNTFAEEQVLRGPIERETCASWPDKWVERGYPPKSPSFPSSHVVTGGACAAALTAANPWLGAAGWLYAGAEGWGRLYWGKHWPSDLLGSLVLAAFAGRVAWRLAPVVIARLRRRRPASGPNEPGSVG